MGFGDFISSLTSQFSSSVEPTRSEKDAETTGVANRNAAETISNSLGQNYHGEYMPETVARMMENFEGMSHDDILEYRDSIDTQGLHASVDAWNKIADDLHTKCGLFQGAIEGQLNNGWAGATADAAKASVRQFADDVDSLKNAAQIVASKVGDAAATLTQVKNQIPGKPQSTTSSLAGVVTDVVANAVLPGAGVTTGIGHLMTDHGRADNAQSEARDVMNNVYAKYLPDADKQVPKMPGVTKADKNPGGASGPSSPARSSVAPSSYNSHASSNGPSSSSGASSAGPTSGNPTSSDPGGPTGGNSSTSPSSLNLPDATTGTSSGYSPSTATAGYSPSGAGTAGTTGTGGLDTSGGGAGSSVPGASAGRTAAATAATAANKAGSGLGSMMPHAQKKDGEGDKEHKTADYLHGIQEDLLPPEPRLLPDGVIGGDYAE